MKRIFAALLVSLAATAATAAPDLEKGKEIAETVCIACHAADGNSGIAIYPRLAGQHAAYTAKHAKDIRDRVRTWSLAESMVAMVESMTDEDIDNVSAFYEKQVSLAGEADAANLKAGELIYRGGIAEQKCLLVWRVMVPTVRAFLPHQPPKTALWRIHAFRVSIKIMWLLKCRLSVQANACII